MAAYEVLGKVFLLPAVECDIERRLQRPVRRLVIEGNEGVECLLVGGAAFCPGGLAQAQNIDFSQVFHQAGAAVVRQGDFSQNGGHAEPGGSQTSGCGEKGIVIRPLAGPVNAQHPGCAHDAASAGAGADLLQRVRLYGVAGVLLNQLCQNGSCLGGIRHGREISQP